MGTQDAAAARGTPREDAQDYTRFSNPYEKSDLLFQLPSASFYESVFVTHQLCAASVLIGTRLWTRPATLLKLRHQRYLSAWLCAT